MSGRIAIIIYGLWCIIGLFLFFMILSKATTKSKLGTGILERGFHNIRVPFQTNYRKTNIVLKFLRLQTPSTRFGPSKTHKLTHFFAPFKNLFLIFFLDLFLAPSSTDFQQLSIEIVNLNFSLSVQIQEIQLPLRSPLLKFWFYPIVSIIQRS